MNVLFVCTGNTCRSPMAEGYLKSLGLDGVSVKSRGLAAAGESVSENSVIAMSELGIDISRYISQQITVADIEWADRIICMSDSHLQALMPFAKEKLCVLGSGIVDPFGSGLATYIECRDGIIAAINQLFLKFTVRAVEREDIKQIAQLEKICFSQPWSMESLLEAHKNGTRFLVAVSDKKVLGYVGISCIIDEGYITNVAVFPEYRKRGVASAILNAVSNLAKQLNLSFVSLEVRVSNNAAISLYEKLGFKIEGKRPRFYREPEEDAYIMTKRFE